MGKIWELDFYSRPILDDGKKKLWEVLICETPTEIQQNPETLFRYSEFCPSTTVNSLWLKEAIEKAVAQSGEAPKKIRFFRRQMNNMILKAAEDAGIIAAPSRRTHTLSAWIDERNQTFYPEQAGYDENAARATPVQYPPLAAVALPDAVRVDRSDRWAFVSLEASAFAEMKEWDIAFGEAFPLSLTETSPDTKIPGLIIFSSRALPLAAWMSGLELGYLQFEAGSRPMIRLETGTSDSWILANVADAKTLSEAKGFESLKEQAGKVHFLAVQSKPESESFAGFWLLKQENL
jgi:hypothetical protein